MQRPAWDEYFLQIAQLVASRSTCTRRQVGAVLVQQRHVLATGYNGVPSGITHCDQSGCLREQLQVPSGERHELCRGLHAEQNAIIQAAKHGVNIAGATLYCTDSPCVICSKMLINADISRIVWRRGYPDRLSLEMLAETGLKCHQWDEESPA